MPISILKKNILFADLSEEEIQKLLEISCEIKHPAKTFVIQEGDEAKEFFMILAGEADVVKWDETNQHSHVIAHLGTGDCIGEIALIDEGRRSASIVTTTDARFLSIPLAKIRALSEENPNIYKLLLRIARNLSVRLRQTNETTLKALQKHLEEYKMR